MKIKVGVSNRHIHLSKKDYDYLFPNEEMQNIKPLSQDGEFATNLTLDIKTDKNVIKNVRLVSPFRDKTQVEISITDSYFLDIKPPVRMSGNFIDATDITLVNKDRELTLSNACIIANRHIHVNTKDLSKYDFYPGKSVRVKVDGIRGGILDNVLVKSKDNYNLELHLDTDEANAFGLKNGDIVEIMEES